MAWRCASSKVSPTGPAPPPLPGCGSPAGLWLPGGLDQSYPRRTGPRGHRSRAPFLEVPEVCHYQLGHWVWVTPLRGLEPWFVRVPPPRGYRGILTDLASRVSVSRDVRMSPLSPRGSHSRIFFFLTVAFLFLFPIAWHITPTDFYPFPVVEEVFPQVPAYLLQSEEPYTRIGFDLLALMWRRGGRIKLTHPLLACQTLKGRDTHCVLVSSRRLKFYFVSNVPRVSSQSKI